MTLRTFTAALLCAASTLGGCRAREHVIAELERGTGSVERDYHTSVGTWKPAAPGATFVVGDGVQTGAASSAKLRLFKKSELTLDARTRIRFRDRPSAPEQAGVALDMGEVSVDEALDVETELGTARVEAHGRVRVVRDGQDTRLEVVIGSAQILHDGQKIDLTAGQAVEGGPGQPLERKSIEPPPPAPVASDAPAPATSASEQAGERANPEPAPVASGEAAPNEAFTRGPELVDIEIGAGDSLVIHDPHPPTAIGVLTTGRCPGRAVVAVDPSRSHAQQMAGAGRVGMELRAGAHRYVLHCLAENGGLGPKVAEGSVSVIADAGSRQIAKTAPLTSLDADGRRYTVLYQSVLPRVALRWPTAPAAASYALTLRSPNGTKTVNVTTAASTFAPGALVEGEHQFWFEGGGSRSRPTSISIRFDNAAPTASIESPADGSFAAGASVMVRGTALPGWSVSVSGTTLGQDAQNRFSEAVTAPGGLRALAIRFAEPRRGVHYYLRRHAR